MLALPSVSSTEAGYVCHMPRRFMFLDLALSFALMTTRTGGSRRVCPKAKEERTSVK